MLKTETLKREKTGNLRGEWGTEHPSSRSAPTAWHRKEVEERRQNDLQQNDAEKLKTGTEPNTVDRKEPLGISEYQRRLVD